MLKTILKILGVMLLAGYLAVAGWLYGRHREAPTYRGITVHIEYPDNEAHFVNEADIRQLLRRKPNFAPIGKRYDEVNTLELAQYIERQNRLVLRASCYHTPDSLLRIDIEQRTPRLRLMSLYPEVGDAYLDQTAQLMPTPSNASAILLPLATGYIRTSHLPQLNMLADYLADHEFWREMVTQIYVQPNGDVMLVPRVGSHLIRLGEVDADLHHKLNRVRTFYRKVLPHKGWNAYHVISVKYDGQVVGEK